MMTHEQAHTLVRWPAMLGIIALVFCKAALGQQQVELLDFTAPWCGPCRQMEPVMAKLEAQGCHVQRVNIDTEQGKQLARQHQVTRIPLVLVVRGNAVLGRHEGVTSFEVLSGEIRKHQLPLATSVSAASAPRTTPSTMDLATYKKHLPKTGDIAPITRVRRTDTKDNLVSESMMTGIPIAQSATEVLVVTNNHFMAGATSMDCLLGDQVTVKGKVVAADPDSDLALIVGRLDARKYPWKLSVLAAADAQAGEVATLGYPLGKPVKVSYGKLTGDGWCSIRFVYGESGGPLYQDGNVVGVKSARTPSAAEIADPRFQREMMALPDFAKELQKYQGTAQQKITAYFEPLEREQKLGSFIPVSKVRAFVNEAAQKLAFDYPVFTTLFDKEMSNETPSLRGN